MNYEKIYKELILHRQQNPVISGYKENHHIIPSALGGSDDKFNRVNLTAREHYMAHLLLARFQRCSQNTFALNSMQRKNSNDPDKPFIKSARLYEWIRIECARYTSEIMKIAQKGERNSQFGTCWITNLIENKKIMKTDPLPEGWRYGKIQKGIPHSDEQKIKLSIRSKGRQRIHNITLNIEKFPLITDTIPEGWLLGRLPTDKLVKWICNIDLQENKKIRKHDIIPEGWTAGKSKWKSSRKSRARFPKGTQLIYITKDDVTIAHDASLPIPDGYRRGLCTLGTTSDIRKASKSGENNPLFGKRYSQISDGISNRLLEVGLPIPEGFSKGWIKKSI